MRGYWLVMKRVDPHFRKLIDSTGVRTAIGYFSEIRENHPGVFLFHEKQINALGYQYLRKGQIDDAIALFQLNVKEYPESALCMKVVQKPLWCRAGDHSCHTRVCHMLPTYTYSQIVHEALFKEVVS